jgi:class 3 adenylate cyclase
MLAAIMELSGATAPQHAAASETKPQDTAERRQVTVMFSDLVGSTALSARMTLKTCARSSRLSEVCRRDGAALRRLRGEVHGRRRAGVLRLPAGARG